MTIPYSATDTSNSQKSPLRKRGEGENMKQQSTRLRRALGVCAVAAISFTVAACGERRALRREEPTKNTSKPETKAKVGVILPDTASSARWETNDRRVSRRCLQGGRGGVGHPERQRRQGQVRHDRRPDAQRAASKCLLIVNLDIAVGGGGDQRRRPRRACRSIDYDRLTLGGGAQYYVSFDNVAVGTAIGEGLVKCMQDNGKTERPGGAARTARRPTTTRRCSSRATRR